MDLLCIAGFDGYFKDVNPAWERQLGIPRDLLLTRPFIEFVHPEDRAVTSEAMSRLKEGHPAALFENRYRAHDGTYKWLLWNATPLPGSGLIYATARDITEQHLLNGRLAIQYGISEILGAHPTLAEAARHILRLICEKLEWELGALWKPNDDGTVLRCVDTWARPGAEVEDFLEVSGVMSFPRGIGLPGRVWMTSEPAWIGDVVTDSNFPRLPIAATSGLHAAFAFPIPLDQQAVGVMEFFSRETRGPDRALLALMRAVGSQIGQFMARRDAEQQREALVEDLETALKNVKQLSGLVPICASCNKIRDTDGIWHRVEDYIAARTDASFTHGVCRDCAKAEHPEWDDVP
jgi:PAS domain S-box-containing protein